MGTEALAGTRASFDPFIHSVARPHPGQVRDRFALHLATQTADTFLRSKRLRISSVFWKAASSPKCMTKRSQSRRMKAPFVKTDTHCALRRSSLALRSKILFTRLKRLLSNVIQVSRKSDMSWTNYSPHHSYGQPPCRWRNRPCPQRWQFPGHGCYQYHGKDAPQPASSWEDHFRTVCRTHRSLHEPWPAAFTRCH